MRRLAGAIAALLIGVATAIVITGVAVTVFVNPIWVSLGQERAESGVLTGYGPSELSAATGAILSDLVFGPPDFDVEVAGEPVLDEREREHMRNVRSVFVAFYAVVVVAAVVFVVTALSRRRSPAFWRRVGRGGRALAVVVLAGGLTGLIFFDAAFEVFHQLFFPSGSYTFDPDTERLVQLFPNQFWVDTSIALGALLIILGFAVSSWAGRRARMLDPRAVTVATTRPPLGPDTDPQPHPTS